LRRRPADIRFGSGDGEVAGRGLAGLAIGDQLVGHDLAIDQLAEAGALDGADVDEDVLAAVLTG
jgi:hypothetical protein